MICKMHMALKSFSFFMNRTFRVLDMTVSFETSSDSDMIVTIELHIQI